MKLDLDGKLSVNYSLKVAFALDYILDALVKVCEAIAFALQMMKARLLSMDFWIVVGLFAGLSVEALNALKLAVKLMIEVEQCFPSTEVGFWRLARQPLSRHLSRSFWRAPPSEK